MKDTCSDTKVVQLGSVMFKYETDLSGNVDILDCAEDKEISIPAKYIFAFVKMHKLEKKMSEMKREINKITSEVRGYKF